MLPWLFGRKGISATVVIMYLHPLCVIKTDSQLDLEKRSTQMHPVV